MKVWPSPWALRLGSVLALVLALSYNAPAAGLRTGQVQPQGPDMQAQMASPIATTPVDGSRSDYIQVEGARKGSACYINTGGGTQTYTEVWRLPASGLTYVINTASIPRYLNTNGVTTATQQAAAAWVSQGAPPLVYGGSVSSSGTIGDGVNTISFGSTPAGSASVATIHIVNGIVVEADITLDVTNPWSLNPNAIGDCGGDPQAWDVQGDLTHEFGHWIGAGHTSTDDAYRKRTMYPEIDPGELIKRSPMAGDIASIPAPIGTPSTYSGTVVRSGDDDGGP